MIPLMITSSNLECEIIGWNIVFASVRMSKLPSNNKRVPDSTIRSIVSLFGSLKILIQVFMFVKTLNEA